MTKKTTFYMEMTGLRPLSIRVIWDRDLAAVDMHLHVREEPDVLSALLAPEAAIELATALVSSAMDAVRQGQPL